MFVMETCFSFTLLFHVVAIAGSEYESGDEEYESEEEYEVEGEEGEEEVEEEEFEEEEDEDELVIYLIETSTHKNH
jgi:hypothetical protein